MAQHAVTCYVTAHAACGRSQRDAADGKAGPSHARRDRLGPVLRRRSRAFHPPVRSTGDSGDHPAQRCGWPRYPRGTQRPPQIRRRGEVRRGEASGGYCRIRSSFSCSCAILACAAASAASSVRAAATPTQRRGTAGGGGPVPAGPRAAWVGPLRGAGGRLGRYSQDRLRLLPCPSSVPRATRGRPGAAHVALSVGASPAQAGRQALGRPRHPRVVRNTTRVYRGSLACRVARAHGASP